MKSQKTCRGHARPSLRHFLFAILGCCWAGTEVRGDLQFPRQEMDAGEVRAGAPLVYRFTFVNQGPQVVEITDLQTSCGCLTPKLDRRQLKPGEEGSLLMEVNTLSEDPGRNAWQITMTYRTEGRSLQIPLRITGTVKREIVVEPAAVMIIANAAIGSEIRVTDLRSQPFSIKEVSTSATGLDAHSAGESSDASGHRVQTIRLQLAGDFPDGRHDEILSIYTNDPAYRELKVPVTIVKRAGQRLSALPGQVELLAPPGQPVPSRIVLVRDNENQEVLVDGVVSDSPAITCQWAKGPGNMATLKISANRKLISEQSLQGAVQVNISKPVKQTLSIPVRITLQ